MNKTELVAQMVERSGLSKKDVEAALEAYLISVVDTVASGEKVQLVGFGTFEKRERKARQGVNPQNPQGGKIDIPASSSVGFKVGKSFKEALK